MDIMGEIYDYFLGPIAHLMTLLWDSVATLYKTIDMINSVEFRQMEITQYLGYVRYLTGDFLWSMLWLCCAIPVGVYVFNSLLKGINLIRDLLS